MNKWILICCLLILSSCVSKKVYNSLQQRFDDIEMKLLLTQDSLSSTRDDIIQLMKVSNENIDLSFITSIEYLNVKLFNVDTACNSSKRWILSGVVDELKLIARNTPINGVVRNEYELTDGSLKIYFIYSGKSDVLSKRIFYETVIYVFTLYFSDNDQSLKVSVDYLPLISASKVDVKRFLYSEDQLNSYRYELNEMLNNVKLSILKKNNFNCLY